MIAKCVIKIYNDIKEWVFLGEHLFERRESRPYQAKEVARYIVDYCDEVLQKPISNLQLQKILYFVWIDYYREKGKELFTDNIYAWQLGPVVADVYFEYCSYGGVPIHTLQKKDSHISEPDKTTINELVKKYINDSVYKLVQKTHAPGKPWHIIYDNGAGNKKKIPLELIKRLECKDQG